jgi:hypothetical protein
LMLGGKKRSCLVVLYPLQFLLRCNLAVSSLVSSICCATEASILLWTPACIMQALPTDGILSPWPQSPFSLSIPLIAHSIAFLEPWETLESLLTFWF